MYAWNTHLRIFCENTPLFYRTCWVAHMGKCGSTNDFALSTCTSCKIKWNILETFEKSSTRGSILDRSQVWLLTESQKVSKSLTPSSHCQVLQFSSVQSLSRVQLFATPWIAAHQASLSITNSRSSLRLTSIELVIPSSHLILCHPLLLLAPIFPSIRVFSSESTLHMRWPKYWSFSFSISPSNEHPGLISFRMDWLDLLAGQGTLKSLFQHHSSKASILRCSAFFTVQLTSIHDHWKNHSLD